MNYTLHQLQIFLKITETCSITKAARELHLTQPAVSIQLRNFQNQFRIPLTEIVGRKLYITDFGKEVAVSVSKILAEVRSINYKALAFKGDISGQLKLSIVSTGSYVMPYFLSEFIALHPGVDLVMDVTNKLKVQESLERNEVDFSLVSVLPSSIQTENVQLVKNTLYLVGNGNRKFEDVNYDISILEELPLIYRENGSGTRYIMEAFLNQNSIKTSKKLELTSNEAVKQAVLAGLGYSIMPIIGIKNELIKGSLQIIPVSGFPIRSFWNLIWLKNKNFSPVASAYLSYIKEEKDHIIERNFSWVQQYDQ